MIGNTFISRIVSVRGQPSPKVDGQDHDENYDQETMRVLRQAKELMDSGMSVSQAFGRARGEIEREEQHND